MSFTELGLAEPILRAIAEQGYATPTPIQQQAIPVVLNGRDLMAAAQTGTGKTAGFTLPMLQRLQNGKRVNSNSVRALVLTPTRELAAQVGESVRDYGKYLSLSSLIVFGGVSINPQMMGLRRGVDILVATPGRLLDLYSQNAIKFNQVEMLVLDEADRMLDMGFIRDIRKILDLLPKQRQNLLFSATFSDDITALAKGILYKPEQIAVSPRNTAAETVQQSVYKLDKTQKIPLLSHLIRSQDWQQVLVFTRTKHGANRLAEKLERDGISAAAIHGNKSQGARTKALSDFKQNAVRVLVATDIAARGLDIEQLPYVVNFELPNVPADYVHRIGRTGRAGANGQAISLVEPEEFSFLQAIEKLLKQKLPCEALPALPKGSAITKVDKPVANVKATDERAKQGQHRPKKRRTKSQKTEARVAAGLQTAKAPKLGVAASKPQRRPARKPAA
jgi:ATP-dependent RNA helicase RhlE